MAFRKTAWAQIGGYPEWLDYCEDLIFDLKMGNFAWAPEALVYFRPRASLGSFYSQYYRYARGDGKADLWRKRHLIRYATYCVALPLLLVALWLGSPLVRGLGWLGVLAGILYYCGRPWQRIFQIGRRRPPCRRHPPSTAAGKSQGSPRTSETQYAPAAKASPSGRTSAGSTASPAHLCSPRPVPTSATIRNAR